MKNIKRFQVWISEDQNPEPEEEFLRFNARFASYEAALAEVNWYLKHNYVVEIFDSSTGRTVLRRRPEKAA